LDQVRELFRQVNAAPADSVQWGLSSARQRIADMTGVFELDLYPIFIRPQGQNAEPTAVAGAVGRELTGGKDEIFDLLGPHHPRLGVATHQPADLGDPSGGLIVALRWRRWLGQSSSERLVDRSVEVTIRACDTRVTDFDGMGAQRSRKDIGREARRVVGAEQMQPRSSIESAINQKLVQTNLRHLDGPAAGPRRFADTPHPASHAVACGDIAVPERNVASRVTQRREIEEIDRVGVVAQSVAKQANSVGRLGDSNRIIVGQPSRMNAPTMRVNCSSPR
jgi:hypothetical protein